MRIAYVGQYHVDRDSAGLQRVLGISSALAHAGHRVVVGGQGVIPDGQSRHELVELDAYGTRRFDSRITRIATGAGVGAWLDSLTERPDLVISYGGTGFFVDAVRRWTRRNRVPRVVDSVEWYETASMPGGRYGPKAIDNEISMRRRYPSFDGVIAISRFLEDHYARSGTSYVVRVPPVTDVESVCAPDKATDGPVSLLYAGSPGAKDSLGVVVQALGQVDPDGHRMRLEVIGVSPDEARAIPGIPVEIPTSCVFRGRLSRAEVLESLMSAHYVPIIRRDERYAHAGFPTKLVEAMASGTALIANCTSDIGEYLRHGQTGLISRDDSVSAVIETLRSALEGGSDLASEMGRSARQVALEHFDYRQHASVLDKFVRDVVGMPDG